MHITHMINYIELGRKVYGSVYLSSGGMQGDDLCGIILSYESLVCATS